MTTHDNLPAVRPRENLAALRPRETRPAVSRLPEDFPAERVALVDLLDRVLAAGVVVTGDITLSIADVDLVKVSLRALLASVSTLSASETEAGEPGGEGP
jgi:gas vesicle protein GvpA/GvpJ/GvpM family